MLFLESELKVFQVMLQQFHQLSDFFPLDVRPVENSSLDVVL